MDRVMGFVEGVIGPSGTWGLTMRGWRMVRDADLVSDAMGFQAFMLSGSWLKLQKSHEGSHRMSNGKATAAAAAMMMGDGVCLPGRRGHETVQHTYLLIELGDLVLSLVLERHDEGERGIVVTEVWLYEAVVADGKMECLLES